jgi:hypothetical protein
LVFGYIYFGVLQPPSSFHPEDEDSKFSETFVTTYQTEWYNKSDKCNLELHYSEKLKSICMSMGFLGRKGGSIAGPQLIQKNTA